MTPEFTMSSRIVNGYGDRQFHIFTDEIIPFLRNCDDNGLTKITDIVNDLIDIKDLIETSEIKDAKIHKRYVHLLDDLSVLVRGAIYENN